jgi:hypothetical protein
LCSYLHNLHEQRDFSTHRSDGHASITRCCMGNHCHCRIILHLQANDQRRQDYSSHSSNRQVAAGFESTTCLEALAEVWPGKNRFIRSVSLVSHPNTRSFSCRAQPQERPFARCDAIVNLSLQSNILNDSSFCAEIKQAEPISYSRNSEHRQWPRSHRATKVPKINPAISLKLHFPSAKSRYLQTVRILSTSAC